MIPLALITGFLGSGKTTLLKHLTRLYAHKRIVCLVNEFSDDDIDGRLLQNDVQNLLAIPGGSIFCVCLVSEFIRVLKEIPQRFSHPQNPIDGVIIEASGIANPKVIARMLHETNLDQTYAISSIIAVVDPGAFPVLLQTLPNIQAQVEACDTILLNKTDLFPESLLAQTEQQLRTLNPGATLLRSQFAQIPLDLFHETAPRNLAGDYAPCRDPHFLKINLHIPYPVRLNDLTTAITECGAIYRAKGFIPTTQGMVYLDVATEQIHIDPAPHIDGPGYLVLILPPDRAGQANAFAHDLTAGRYNDPPK